MAGVLSSTPAAYGESLESWVDRACAAAHATLADVLGTPPTTTTVAQSSGNPVAFHGVDVRPLVLGRWDGLAFDLAGPSASWAFRDRTRMCPRCVSEDGGVWQLWWRTGFGALCTRHLTVLVDRCHACRQPYRHLSGQRPAAAGHRVPDPCGCDNPVDGGVCGRSAVKAVSPWMYDDPADRASYAQDLLVAALHGDTHPTVDGRDAPLHDWFGAVRDLMVLYARFATAGDCERGGAPRCASERFAVWEANRSRRHAPPASGPGAPPSTAMLTAATLVPAVHAATRNLESTVDVLTRRAALVVPDAADVPDQMTLSPAVRRAWADTTRRCWAFSTVSVHETLGSPRHGYPHLTADNVPAYASERAWRQVAALLPVGHWPGRLFLSLSIVRAADGLRWPEAAVALGVPVPRALSTVDRCAPMVVDAAAWWRTVHRLCRTMQATTRPIDWSNRRTLLRQWPGLTSKEWQWVRLVADEPNFGRDGRRRNASAAVWSAASGNHPRDLPWTRDAVAENVLAERSAADGYRRFERWLEERPAVHAHLLVTADTLSSAVDREPTRPERRRAHRPGRRPRS